MHVGGDTVEINIEAAGSDVTEYTPTDDKPSAGMFGFLYCYIVCINLIHWNYVKTLYEVIISMLSFGIRHQYQCLKFK